MADTLTTSVGLYDVTATYDGNGNATGLQVRYIRTITDVTTGSVYQVIKGPFPLSTVTFANLLTNLLSALPAAGQGT